MENTACHEIVIPNALEMHCGRKKRSRNKQHTQTLSHTDGQRNNAEERKIPTIPAMMAVIYSGRWSFCWCVACIFYYFTFVHSFRITYFGMCNHKMHLVSKTECQQILFKPKNNKSVYVFLYTIICLPT